MEKPLSIAYLSIDSLIPYAKNARTHSESQVSQIAASIKEFGFTNPILIDDKNGIIAGHGRCQAAKKLGMTEVPTIKLSQLSEAQRKAYIIADNRLAELSAWDQDLLSLDIMELNDLDFDVHLTGFGADDFLKNEVDYSVLEDNESKIIDEMKSGVRKAIQIEFELEHYDEAFQLVKYWREQGAYVGMFLMDKLRSEKEKLKK